MGRTLDKLTVKGFKSIRSLEDFELRNLNILIGANGSGKSNFISLFTLLRAIVEQRLQLAVAQAGGADAHLYLGPKITKVIEVRLHFEPNGYEFTLVPTPGNTLVFLKELVLFEGIAGSKPQVIGRGHVEARLKDASQWPGATAIRGIPWYVYAAISAWTVYHFHDTSPTAGVRRKGTVRDNETLREDASNLAAFLLRLKNDSPDDYQRIRDTVRLAAPFFDDFKLRPETSGSDEVVQLEWTQRGSDYPFHPSQLSDGTLRFICLAVALLQPHPPQTILLDEPELGLHPFALEILASLLKEYATSGVRFAPGIRLPGQVIVSTQSAPLLNYFEPVDVIIIDRKNGESTFKRLDATALAAWLEEYTLGELWQKNVFDGGPVHE